MNKPPVLSEFTITLEGKEVVIGGATIYGTPLMSLGMQAQRDADVECYQKAINKMQKRFIDVGEAAIQKILDVEEQKVKQAREDTAREIFEILEEAFRNSDNRMGLFILSREWQSLKSKYLGEPQ